MVQGNLIRGIIPREGDVPAEGELSAAPPDTGEGEEMKVTGTLSGHWSFARVTIVEKGKAESQEFGIGETVGGYKIRSIALNYVVLERGGRFSQSRDRSNPGRSKSQTKSGYESGGRTTSYRKYGSEGSFQTRRKP